MASHPYIHALVEGHWKSLRVAWHLFAVLWLIVFGLGAVASCTVYKKDGVIIGAIGGKGAAKDPNGLDLWWNNDESFKDAARVAGTVTLAPVAKEGIKVVGDLVTGKTATDTARIAADQAIEQSTIEAATRTTEINAALQN